MSIRKTVVAGSFYPNSKSEILNYIKEFNSMKTDIESFENIKALIVPHAGYIYSGFTANMAYKMASCKNPKRVIVIGPSHRAYLEGASVTLHNSYETPLGNIEMDLDLSKKLIDSYDFLEFNEECEFEHSTETQAPFIKNYFPNAKIIEIVYGDCNYKDLSVMIASLFEDKDNFIVISTDLSHFHSFEKANELDKHCLEAIDKKDMSLFKTCEACGKIGVKAMIEVCKNLEIDTKVLHYCTSYDRTKDKSSVVGYTSALIGN